MELAVILILVSLADLVVGVWLLARHKSYLARISHAERNITALTGAIRDVAQAQAPVVVAPAAAAPLQVTDIEG